MRDEVCSHFVGHVTKITNMTTRNWLEAMMKKPFAFSKVKALGSVGMPEESTPICLAGGKHKHGQAESVRVRSYYFHTRQ